VIFNSFFVCLPEGNISACFICNKSGNRSCQILGLPRPSVRLALGVEFTHFQGKIAWLPGDLTKNGDWKQPISCGLI
jgi:hypothetical protein